MEGQNRRGGGKTGRVNCDGCTDLWISNVTIATQTQWIVFVPGVYPVNYPNIDILREYVDVSPS